MDINDLTDQEKSALLAKAMGWSFITSDRIEGLQFVHDDEGRQVHLTRNERFLPHDPFNLYNPEYMYLAWRVLNWADERLQYFGTDIPRYSLADAFQYFWESKVIYSLSPADAQRLWLDKILELAIEAGLVAEEERG